MSKPASGDESWADLFGFGQLDGDIYAMVPDGHGGFYVGGDFRKSGNQVLNGIARWDGLNWQLLGPAGSYGIDGVVYSIAVAGDDVYVGGKITRAGGLTVNNIAHWNATTNSWSKMAEGIGPGDQSAYVGVIAAAGSDIYAGGWFATAGTATAHSLAKWSGGGWSAVGVTGQPDGVNGDVLGLAVLDSSLYVGGSFNSAGGMPAANVVRWNMQAKHWTQLPNGSSPGIDGYINTIAIAFGEVYVGGSFVVPTYRFNSPDTALNIARLVGGAWDIVGGHLDRWVYGGNGAKGSVRAITVLGDSLYVGGTFRKTRIQSLTGNDAPTSYVARWDNHGKVSNLYWTNLQGGTSGYVNALAAVYPNVFAGGSFRTTNNLPLSRIARWNVPTNAWSGLRSGPTGNILAVGLHGTAEVWAAGLMATSTGASGYRLARWSGTQWQTLATTVDGPIYAMAISGDDIYVGGQFTRAGNVAAANIARYSITTGQWSALGGSGVGGIGTTYVAAIAIRGKDVFVGGDFAIADVVAAQGVARWDGSQWYPVGTGVNGWVNALAIGSSGELYAGGDFSNAGGVPAREVAKWDGTKWSALGEGVNDVVRSMAAGPGGNLYLGGEFSGTGSVASRGLIQWDGSKWVSMAGGVGGGLLPTINGIIVVGNVVYVGGKFESAGGVPVNNIARWDGTGWRGLGSGVDDQIRGMAVGGTVLYVGGDYNIAGGKASFKFGEWTDVPNSIGPRDPSGEAPTIALRQSYPDPVVTMAKIPYSIDNREGARVEVKIYDLLGREVASLVDDLKPAGDYVAEWDASGAMNGLYYCRISSGGEVVTRRIHVAR
jgi:hypothetical protein